MWEIRTGLLHAGGRQQLPSKCVSLPQNAGDLVGLHLYEQVKGFPPHQR